MAHYHQRQTYRNNHWQKFNNRERTLTQDSSASSFASASSSHYRNQSRQDSQTWPEPSGTFQQSSPEMVKESSQAPLPSSTSGQNDLEILEKLKESIISNQNEFFRSVPQPATLAKIFMDNPSISPVPPHPEQIPPAQNEPQKDSPADENQQGGGPSSVDGPEPRQQVRLLQNAFYSRIHPSPRFPLQNGYHHARSERCEPDSSDLADPKPPHSPGNISPSKSTTNLRDSFKSSTPSRPLSHRGSFSRGSFQPSSSVSTRVDNQYHDSPMRGRSLSNARSPAGFGDGRQRYYKPYSEDRQYRTDSDTTARPQPLQHSATLIDFERSSEKGPFDSSREFGDDSRDRSPERDNRRYNRFYRRADDRPRIIDNRRNLPDQRYADGSRPYDNSRSVNVASAIDQQIDDNPSRSYDERTTSRQQPPTLDSDDDRRLQLPPASPIVTNARRPPSPPSSTHLERTSRASAPESTPLLSSNSAAVRNTVDDRTPRQPTLNSKDERKTLEERLSRQPPLTLQERISMPPSSDTRSTPGTPRPALPLEERLSYPPDRARDDRGNRSRPTSPTVTRSPIGSLNQDDRHISIGGSRPTLDEGGRYPPTLEDVDDRKPPGRSSVPPLNALEKSHTPSLSRDDYTGRGTDIRDYRRGGAIGSTTRESNEARGHNRLGGVDRMDLDRYDDRLPRDTYLRNSGMPPETDARDRERGVWDRPRWQESSRNDSYNNDPHHRQGGPTSYPHGHGRYQEYNDRPLKWDGKDHQWGQGGPWGDRDRRFIERDSTPTSGTPSAWETREEREARELRERNARGRPTYPPPQLGPDRGYDPRPSLTSKISPQRYSPVPVEGRPGRDMDPPAIYSQPPIPVSSDPNSNVSNNASVYSSRIRPRSPSPMSVSRDSSRPPMKRQREDFVPSASNDYYPPRPPGEANPNGSVGGNDYPPSLSSRMSTGPMPHLSGLPSGYYGHSAGVNVNRGPREYHQGPRDGYPPGPPHPPQGYDRMPPPRYNQNYHQRGNHGRDDRRFEIGRAHV